MTNKYVTNGGQYSPDMGMERESCRDCGLTHMVQYKIVEVTEQVGPDEFLWKEPANVSNLRIIVTSAVDDAARYSGRDAYATLDSQGNPEVGSGSEGLVPPITGDGLPFTSTSIRYDLGGRPVRPSLGQRMWAGDTTRMRETVDRFIAATIPAPQPEVTRTWDRGEGIWVDESVPTATLQPVLDPDRWTRRIEAARAPLDNVEQNPYNTPTGEETSEVHPEVDVGDFDGNAIGPSVDVNVWDTSGYVRPSGS